MWTSFSDGIRSGNFNIAFQQAGIEPEKEKISAVLEIFRNHKPNIQLSKESRIILEILSGNYRFAMLTNGFMPTQRYKVEALDIEQDFEQILYTEELGREFWKPSPRGFEVLLERLDLEPADCVYIADNAAWDFNGPHSLGMPTIHVCSPDRIQDNQPTDEMSTPQQKITSLIELPELLVQMRCRCCRDCGKG